MTMQPPNDSLPPPGWPLVTRVISHAIFPDGAPTREEPIMWVLSQPHPFVPTMQIVRMFVVRSSGIEIYSRAGDGTGFMRNLLPMHWVRFVEEAMPEDVFVDELALAEAGGDDEPDFPEPEPGDPGIPGNGQVGPAAST
jgi:hypothetical protein